MSRSSSLREALKREFYPYVEERGFTRGKATSLFTPFRRMAGNTVHVFDVQWDKYGAPQFVINFGEAEVGAGLPAGVHISAPELEPHHCLLRGRLQRRRGGTMSAWFQLRKPWVEVILSGQLRYNSAEVASQVMGCFPELEAWWSNKQEGPHVWCSRAG